MALDIPFSSTFTQIPTPDELDDHFASLEASKIADKTETNSDISSIIQSALTDAHTFASQLRNHLRSSCERLRSRSRSKSKSRTPEPTHDEIQSHLRRDLASLRQLQANIRADPAAGWQSVNHNARQKGYLLCFGVAVDERGVGVVVVCRRPLGSGFERSGGGVGRVTDVDRYPSRRGRLGVAVLGEIW
ncbi:hypothetical protein PMZ80_004115 [Knufia obscura]|uniref:Uncharacterized protein n=2 Tax=Knufia TaxID=430999 RepID=A0AAN8I2Y0_9EURO|nr:hypothetical protein PMZ80_004115 [Knufia obscura]KAK5952157.1 hypothetical protein OHC33_006630 [Knufia fluminis]